MIPLSLPRGYEHGAVLVDGVQIAALHRCCHCGAIFEIVNRRFKLDPNANKRQYTQCLKCSDNGRVAFTCGSETCLKYHVPFEARLDYAEGKQTSYGDVIRESGVIL